MKKYSIFLSISILLLYFSFNIQANDNSPDQKTALLLIDIQEFYFPNGALPLFEPEKTAENAKKVLNYFRENNMTVIHIKHKASSGSEIHKLVEPIDGEKIITKTKANSFVDTDLLDYLKSQNITNIVLCGMQTHMCLEAATRAASDYGFTCTVVENACTTRDLKYNNTVIKASDVHNSTLSTLKGTYAEIVTVDEFLKATKE